MEAPIPFITTTEDGQLKVNEGAISIISQAKGLVSVIAIVGKYRTGKSYIMNRFFDKNAGFNLGGTVQPETKGIWIWARPHPNDPAHTLILLDTEGLHDPEKADRNHDIKLFSLVLLLSNCLIYNTVGTIDDTIIHQLHLVTELTEHIKTKDNQVETGIHFNAYFPTLFLLLRDFFLKLEIKGKPCSSNEYMENALKFMPGHTPTIKDYNAPRECIRAYFPNRSCFTLCKPVEDDDKLTHLDQISESEIKKDFLDQATKVTDVIRGEAKSFTVDGNSLNGHCYMELACMYVQTMNDGGIPCISSVVELMKSSECQRAIKGALVVFDQILMSKLSGKLPVDQDYLDDVQRSAHAEALKYYHQCALFDEKGEFIKNLSAELENMYKQYTTKNNKSSSEKCNEVLVSCFQTLNHNLQTGNYIGGGKYKLYKTDRQQAIQQYQATPNKGPLSEHTLMTFLEMRKPEEDSIINADKALSDKEKELARESEQRIREEERAKAAELKERQLQSEFLRQQAENGEMLLKMQMDFQQKQTVMMEAYSKDMKEKEQEYNRLVNEGIMNQAEQYKTIIEDMKEDKARQEELHQQNMEQIEEYRTKHADLVEEIKQEKQLTTERIDDLKQKFKEMIQPESWVNWMWNLIGMGKDVAETLDKMGLLDVSSESKK